ncbi:MAG: hypothetical protein ACKO7P_04115 [Bacteroidota bacterium]
MRNLLNLEQVSKSIEELKAANWKYFLKHFPKKYKYSRMESESKFKGYSNRYYHQLFLLPEAPFLGFFNRLHIAERAYNFSIIDNNTINDQLAPIFEEIEKLKDPGIQLIVNDDFSPKIISKRNLNISNIWELIQQIFSDEFILTNKLSVEYLEKHLEQLKIKPIKSNSQKSQYNNFRLEEMRNDLRIVFMANPKTFEVKLSYSYCELKSEGFFSPNKGMNSPVSAFFYNFFSEMSFWRFVSKNVVQLAIKSDYAWEYSNCNNTLFSITHHTSGMRMNSPFGVAISSGKAQMKFVDELLVFMILNFGEDDFQYTEIKRETEFYCETVTDIDEKLKKLKYYDGLRSYSTPLFDINIRFSAIKIGNQLYFNTSIHVFPYHNLPETHKINKGWEEHPMVEFWEIK